MMTARGQELTKQYMHLSPHIIFEQRNLIPRPKLFQMVH